MTTFVAALVLAPVPTPEGQWGPSPLAPTALARRVDLRLATLSRAKVSYRFNYDRPKAVAFADCAGTIYSPTKFEVEVPLIDESKGVAMVRETWVEDKKSFGLAVRPVFPTPKPVALRSKGPAHPASAWFLNFSQVIFSGLGQATHPFERLVAEAGRFGLQTTVQRRQITFKGQQIVSYRLVLAKPGTRYETVIDGHGFLPVSVTNTVGLRDNVRWTGVSWDSRRTVKLDPNKARFRKEAAVLPLSPAPRRR